MCIRDSVHGGDARPWEPGAGVFRFFLHPALHGDSQRFFRGLRRYLSLIHISERPAFINNWSGTTASMRCGQKGNYFRFNINNPSTEQTYLKVTNDGTIFAELGERILCGGWMSPTTYSVGNTYCPIFNTRYGPWQPIFYLSLIRGRPRIMLYDDTGSLILDESVTPSFSLVNGGWYFIACLIEPDNKTAQYVDVYKRQLCGC